MDFAREYTNVHGDEYEIHFTGYIQFDTDLNNIKNLERRKTTWTIGVMYNINKENKRRTN